ncbi:DoxX family protein [Sphingomonas parva]|uniref:DoxX family protein n=1 Tax=Sphingomonas parva TaxID=2555898 RepID=A0A4Y8ZMA4_9SPHN|nr:DoxX family protein [Sphingomonas parva]TFI57128.1 DoxX family protein [Sphingomonas parva]
MRNFHWNSVLSWLLSAFFIVGGISNIIASEAILSDYDRWGYPEWFHYVTGMLELTAAILIFQVRSRKAGIALAAGIMLSAAVTVLVHGELTRAIAPLLVLFVAIVAFLTTGAKRRRT